MGVRAHTAREANTAEPRVWWTCHLWHTLASKRVKVPEAPPETLPKDEQGRSEGMVHTAKVVDSRLPDGSSVLRDKVCAVYYFD